MASHSNVLAHPLGDACFRTVQHTGTAIGKTEQVGGMPTYITGANQTDPKAIVLFFSDVFGPFYINNQLLMDYYASQGAPSVKRHVCYVFRNHGYKYVGLMPFEMKGFTVLGIDYFLGDPVTEARLKDKNFDRNTWRPGVEKIAEERIPGWIEAIKQRYPGAKFCTVGNCFGAPYAMDACKDDSFVCGSGIPAAVAHPSKLTEDHFTSLRVPILLACAEIDHAFPAELRRRAEDIFVSRKHTYHFTIFSGVSHGFAARGDPNVENDCWAKEECARGIVQWFKRFTSRP
ncbi:hypothetical protein CONPUDRAFT_82517 [Coniophora puteana RWD-64-598 SS2]|uniref:Dienelactone hydrolase domain-containing protein n=1 Tax=Coniophora puteana (strain RWD-64-598) TaxID=741705 RepID=A0A5M3MNF3_CONPW|nr:uncharacterized protein CONPUDRAFT_82517 [Coniophora puteana RWD-64-598 SS2]EIW80151.1 hypothetical protein CONPUDRAFT_82517 [Coniophora puteana RWD-64-598 SS2]